MSCPTHQIFEVDQIESAVAISQGCTFVFECLAKGNSPSHILDLSQFQEENIYNDL